MKYQEAKNRKNIQLLFFPLLPLVIVGGWFWPYFGYIALTMMIFLAALSLFKGRYYCGWFCAMGAFFERLLGLISLNRPMPRLFKESWFKWLVFVLMIGLMVSRLIAAGGDAAKTGAVFTLMWTVSTTIAVFIGLVYRPRSWCGLCPMALFQGLLSPGTHLLTVASACRECGRCAKVCPIETDPGSRKAAGFVKSADCMRCGNCVVNCPVKALSFADRQQIVPAPFPQEARERLMAQQR